MDSKVIYKDKRWLIDKYINEKLSMQVIADLCDVAVPTIFYWLKKFEIPSRLRGEYLKGKKVKPFTEEHKRKLSEAAKGRKRSEAFILKQIQSRKGYKHSDETKRKISEGQKGNKRSKEHGQRISKRQMGMNNPNWKGGGTFALYCYLFNNVKKEEIRNRDNRVCQLCGKSEILNGERLSVHHIDNDKMQGCAGRKWYLVSLCRCCNVRKDTIEKEFILASNLHWRVNNG